MTHACTSRWTAFRASLPALLTLLTTLCAPSVHAQAPTIDVELLRRLTPAEARIQTVPKGFDSANKESVYLLAVDNLSGAALPGPVYVTIDELSTGVTVKNATGRTVAGVPYFLMSSADVAAGARLTKDLRFANVRNVRFAFKALAYATRPSQTPDLQVAITRPGTLITVGSTPVSVEGTINDPRATLTLNGAPVPHSSGRFQADVAVREGHNAIIARAVNAAGTEATATIAVSLDVTPPYVTIESPTEAAVLSSSVVSVSGLINDIVRGTVSEGQANVTVNGRPASVANRSYLANDIPLQEGLNTIQVQASDQVGNTGQAEVHVSYRVPTSQFIELAHGQNQQAQVREVLAQSLQVKLQQADGTGVAAKPVIFRVSQGDGAVGVDGSDEGAAVLALSDSNGVASTRFRLGSRAGSGNNRVTARAMGFEGEVVFVATATPQAGDKVSVNSGNNQRGAARQPLPLPFVVVVTDAGTNVIAAAEVEFRVIAGGGRFHNGEDRFVATTDSDGRAGASLTLGSEIGLDVHRVGATLLGTQFSAGFTASALRTGEPGATAISGVVMDNQDRPLPNVTMRVAGTTREARSDEQGRFRISEAPVGPVHLIADGSTASVPGEWPTLPYNIVTVSGADNPLSAPVYMVKLDTDHAVTVGAEDRELTLPDVPGFKLTVKAGSATFPNGDRVGQLSATAVNASKIPMAPPNGMQPQFIVTIQPAGVRFDPPAPLQLPNVDGHPPGAQVEMYSFDHDLEEFVAIGLGTVNADGTTIASNRGVGVIKAGWHCGSQPGGSGCVAACNVCQQSQSDCTCTERPASALRALLGDEPPVDDISHDCRRPQCPGPGYVAYPADVPVSRCKACSGLDVTTVPDGSHPAISCLLCKRGAEVDLSRFSDPGIGVSTIHFPPYTPIVPPDGAYGITIPNLPVESITPYCAGVSWKARVIAASGEILYGARVVPLSIDVTEPLIAQTSSCGTLSEMAVSLTNFGAGDYHVLAAVEAHENEHANNYRASMDASFIGLKERIEAVEIPLSATIDHVNAEVLLRESPAYVEADARFRLDYLEARGYESQHQDPQRFIDVETAALAPFLDKIRQRKIALGCPISP